MTMLLMSAMLVNLDQVRAPVAAQYVLALHKT